LEGLDADGVWVVWHGAGNEGREDAGQQPAMEHEKEKETCQGWTPRAVWRTVIMSCLSGRPND